MLIHPFLNLFSLPKVYQGFDESQALDGFVAELFKTSSCGSLLMALQDVCLHLPTTRRTPAVLRASFRWLSVSASMRSLRPSTCVRSRRPPSNARLVNSPRSAGRQNGKNEMALSTEDMIARPECTCNSSTSSVVNDFGSECSMQMNSTRRT